jgi:histidine triad (HIT) family protein
MADSLFTKIIKDEVPAHKIYEDELTLAFLDIFPIVKGHTLVISKNQVDHIWDLSDKDYLAMMETTRKVAQRLREVLQPARVGLKVMGTDVPHAHIHVIPFNDPKEFHVSVSHNETDHTALENLARQLAF